MRSLSQIEQALTITNSAFPLSAICVLNIENGPSAEVLQTAIQRLQLRNPLLKVFIKESNNRFWFEQDKHKKKVILKVVERKDEEQWRVVAREDLNQGYDHTQSPLMRATYIKSSTSVRSEIILSFHHAIADFSFILSLINQLLIRIGENTAESEKLRQANTDNMAQSPLLADVLPKYFKMPWVFKRFPAFIYRQMRSEISYKKRTGEIKDLPIPASSENDIYTLEFSEEETISLIKWSRKNNLSINGILAASMLLVVNRNNYGNQKKIMRAAQFANLRPYLNPPLSSEAGGCFIAMMRFNIPLSPKSSIKQVAAYLDKQLKQSNKRGDKFLFTLLSKMLIKKSFRDQKERLSASALSYAGPVRLKKQYGDIKVADIHGFITNNNLGPELSGFGKICFGRLSLDLNFLSSETGREKASKMVRELKLMLLELINEK